jgi:hypothetical protein
MASKFKLMRSHYENLLQANHRILILWIEKETQFNEIEHKTQSLFISSQSLREIVNRGVQLISQATVDCVHSYGAISGLADWRDALQTSTDKARIEKDRFIQSIVDKGVIFGNDGKPIIYNWEYLQGYGWDTLLMVINRVEGVSGTEWILRNVENAVTYLNDWGFPISDKETDLLLQMLNDYKMTRQIAVVNEREEFSLTAWEAATTLEERQAFLQAYMEAIVPIFSLPALEPLICFLNRWERRLYHE